MVWYGSAFAQTPPTDSLVVSVKFKINDTTTVSPSNLTLVQSIIDTNNVFMFEKIFFAIDHPDLNPWYIMKCEGCALDTLASQLMAINAISDVSGTCKVYSLTCPSYSNNPNDFESLSSLTWYLDKINAQEAWSQTHGNSNQVIGILDIGFYPDNPELLNKVDLSISGGNLVAPLSSVSDPNVHGLAVSFLAAGDTDNDKGLASIGYNSKLALYRGLSNTDVLMGIQYLFNQGVRIFNLSIVFVRADGGCDFDTTEAIFFEVLRSQGAFFVAGAGNGLSAGIFANSSGCNTPNTKLYPSSYESVFSVTGLDEDDLNSEYYHYNSSVDLAAPGVGIYSISFNNNGLTSTSNFNQVQIKMFNGTSSATPLVSGSVALMKSVNPCLNPDDIEAILKQSSDPIPNQNPPTNQPPYNLVIHLDANGDPIYIDNELQYDEYDYPILLGAGRLNAGNAVKLAMDWPFDYPEGLEITSNSDVIEDLNGDGIIRIRGNLVFTEDVDDFSISNKIFEFQRDCSIDPEEAPYFDQSGIIVKRAAQVQFNNCTFRPVSYCPEMFPEDSDQMWDGMQVWGDEELIYTQGDPILSGISYNAVEHGVLNLSNCNVEDAAIGVTCYRRNYSSRFNNQLVGEYGAGQLLASNTTFLNNHIGIDMKSHMQPNVRNYSKIAKCTFIANAPLASNVLYEDKPTNTFVKMTNVRNPEILGCSFEGTPEFAAEGYVTGIRGNNARFKLTATAEYIDNNGNQFGQIDNGFIDLYKGVDVSNLTTIANGIILRDATFEGVLQGITANNANMMEIAFNTLNCYPENINFDTWGVFVRGCQSGLITENEFIGPFEEPDGQGYGLVVRNNSQSEMHVYRNNFTQTFYAANQMEQTNTTTKLQCNTYDQGNVYDWLITSGNLNNQGQCNELTLNPALWANNYFYTCETAEYGLERQIKNLGEGFRYRSHPDNNPHEECVSINVFIEDCPTFDETDDYSSFCPTIVLPTIQEGYPTELIVVHDVVRLWTEMDERERNIAKSKLLSKLFALDSLNHTIEVLQFDYDSMDRKTLALLHLSLGLNTFAEAEIDSILHHHPEDSLFSRWTLEYSNLLDIGKFLSELTNQEFEDYFFKHMDSIQEACIDAFLALAQDSVFTFELERAERGFQTNAFSDKNQPELLLYPNPVSQMLNVEFTDVKGSLLITDLLGQVKYTKNDFAYFHTINTFDFSNGVYIVVVIDETGKRSSSRFIVLK
mgnify:CR=1 FL=1